MPINISNRSVGSGNGSLMTPLLANNPAFKVEILPVDGRLEQQPSSKDGTTQIEAIRVGQAVRGQILSSKKHVKGKVLQINRENGEVVSFKVLDSDGNEVLVDPTTTLRYDEHGQDTEAIGNPGYGIDNDQSNESAIPVYGDWLSSQKTSLL